MNARCHNSNSGSLVYEIDGCNKGPQYCVKRQQNMLYFLTSKHLCNGNVVHMLYVTVLNVHINFKGILNCFVN